MEPFRSSGEEEAVPGTFNLPEAESDRIQGTHRFSPMSEWPTILSQLTTTPFIVTDREWWKAGHNRGRSPFALAIESSNRYHRAHG